MLVVRTPEKYISQPDIIGEAGINIKEYGSKAYIIGGNISFMAVGEKFYKSLDEHKISYTKTKLEGYPTIKACEYHSKLAKDFQADMIIGIGGGRVLDVSKVVGNTLNIPVIAVPTVAATCAAWAACSIIYDEEGNFETVIFNKNTSKLILADTRIIATAPPRYMNAGIIDTFAKWYEIHPNERIASGNISFNIMDHTAKLAYEILEENGKRAVEEGKKGIVSDASVRTVDAIIYLAGLCGSFTEEVFYGGFAHPFYNESTKIPSTRKRLHGEKVALGLLIQLVLEGKPEEYLVEEIKKFAKYGLALTLEDIGIIENAQEDVETIAKGVANSLPSFLSFSSENKAVEIEAAIFKTDSLIRKVKKLWTEAD